MESRTHVLIALLLACSHFWFDLANPVSAATTAVPTADPTAAPTAAPTTETATDESGNVTNKPSTAGPTVDSATNGTEPLTEATTAEPPPATDAPPATEAPKPVELKMTIKMESVPPADCEKVKKAENPVTAEPTQAPTQAPTKAPSNAPTQAPTQAPTLAPKPTEALTQAPTQAPTEATTQGSNRRKRRDVAPEFNAGTFVADAEKEFKKLIEGAGGKDVKVKVSKIVCGSIIMDTDIQGSITKSVEDFKSDLKKEVKANPVKIQGITVSEKELNAAVDTVEDVTPGQEVTKGSLTGGAIAGIVIGVLVIIVIIALVVLQLKKSQKNSAAISSTSRVKLSEVNDGH